MSQKWGGGGGVIREGAYYKNQLPNGGLIREGGLIERGGLIELGWYGINKKLHGLECSTCLQLACVGGAEKTMCSN